MRAFLPPFARRAGLAAVAALSLLLATVAGATAPEGVSFTPTPAWVDVLAIGPLSSPSPSGGLSYLVVDDQVSLRGDEPADYRRLVYDIVDRSGLEDGGRLSIGFQPDFQSVEIHALLVHRDGSAVDRREASRIEILRTEDRADDGILDGWRNAEVLIPDVKVGDRLELEFTVIGDNPVFAGRFHARYGTAYSQGMGVRRVRVLEGRDRLSWKVDSAVDFRVSDTRDAVGRVLDLIAADVPGVVSEGGAPSWFNGFGVIEVGTSKNWSDVAAWSSRLFQRTDAAQSALREKAKELQLESKQPEEAFAAALDYVQSDIRYVSLSIGESAHAPASPDVTLQRRFGDCKDKSSLLVGLLAQAGIDAQPVLVNTDRGHRLPDGLPGTGAFDHAIVRARLDGEWVYADPTRWTEHGPLAGREPIRFAWGLPVAEGIAGLEAIPVPEADDERLAVDVDQRMVMDGEGDEERVEVDVETTYAFGQADSVRSTFSAKGGEQLGRDYLDYMRGMYRDMEADGDPTLKDDRSRNRVVVAERYRTPLVKNDDANGGGSLELRLFQIDDWVPDEDAPTRAWPLALVGPERGRHRIAFEHSSGWNIEPEQQVVENDWFRFERTVALVKDRLIVTGTWQRFSDHVPADAYAEIRDDLQDVRGLLEYPLVFGASNVRGMSTQDLPWTLCALVLLVASLGFAWLGRHVNVAAGMLFEPRATVESKIDSASILPALALLVVLGAWTAALTVLPNALANNAIDWGAAAKEVALSAPHQAFIAGLVWLALRAFDIKPAYRRIFIASAWGSVPALVFVPIALLAAAGASAAVAEPAMTLDGPTWIIALTSVAGIALLCVGIGWTVVSTFVGYAAAAGTSVGRIIVVHFLMFLILLPFATLMAFIRP